MKLYLAGPMTGIEHLNFPAFHYVAKQLRAHDHIVLCPAETLGGETKLPLPQYARFDIHLLLQAEGVVLLGGWENSRGCKKEVAIAEWLELPFFEYGELWAPYARSVLTQIHPHLLLSARVLRT